MEEKLDFSLPEKRQKNAAASWILIVLLLILIGLTAMNLMQRLPGREQRPNATALSLSAEQTKQLAGKLAQRNLHFRAAKVWEEYLAAGNPTDAERARTLFQIGTLLEKASLYDQAIEYFYRSEAVTELDELDEIVLIPASPFSFRVVVAELGDLRPDGGEAGSGEFCVAAVILPSCSQRLGEPQQLQVPRRKVSLSLMRLRE